MTARRMGSIMVGLIALLSACATQEAARRPMAEPANVTGDWNGAWSYAGGLQGIVEMALLQDSGKVTGTVAYKGFSSRGNLGGPITGNINGDQMVYAQGTEGRGRCTVNGDKMDCTLTAGSYVVDARLIRKK